MTLASGPVIPNYGHASACVRGDHLFCWDWVQNHWGDTLQPALVQHMELTGIAVGIGFVLAFALALIAHRVRRLEQPVGAVAAVLYTIPRGNASARAMPSAAAESSTWSSAFVARKPGLCSMKLNAPANAPATITRAPPASTARAPA